MWFPLSENGLISILYLEHIQDVLSDQSLLGVYKNSIFVAVCTALLGLLVTYGAALVTARSGLNGKLKSVIDGIALVTNTIPGMVIGIAFMFIFSGTSLQNTFLLIIICNVVHFFSTPVFDDEKCTFQAKQFMETPRHR